MEEVYHSALPLAGPERHAFVAQRCDGDTALQDEVNSLLSADDFVADFLQEPVVELGIAVLADETLYATEIDERRPQDSSHNLIGEKMAGRYEVIRKLGGGGFGDVYKALDTKVMSRPVVIKVLKDEVLREEAAKRDWLLTKFKQEIEALAKIGDPGVVGIIDADILPDGRHYIVMEFIEGSDLRQFIRDARDEQSAEQGLGFEDVAEIIRQVGRTLSAAHVAEVFHRDLKPENIMLRRNASGDLQVKVIDFGIAKVKNSLIAPSTATGLFVAGTWQYMAPEQLLGKKVDATCDIYALGVIAYELVTGRYPFPAKSAAKLRELQEAGIRVKPCDLNDDLPLAAQDLILKALAYYPAERYPRARDFGDELARALAHADGLVRPDTPAPVDLEGETVEKNDDQPQHQSVEPMAEQLAAAPASWLRLHRRWIYASLALALAGLIGVLAWQKFKTPAQEKTPDAQQLKTAPDAGPERSLLFWLHVRMPRGDGSFDEFDSTGEEAFKIGSKIDFRILPDQYGYLYLINEGMGKGNESKWTALFPNPVDNEKNSQLISNLSYQITGMTLDDNPGDETIHIIWTTEPAQDLEPLFRSEFYDNDRGVFADPEQQQQLKDFFQRYFNTTAALTFTNNPAPRITLKGRGKILIWDLRIKHRKYGS